MDWYSRGKPLAPSMLAAAIGLLVLLGGCGGSADSNAQGGKGGETQRVAPIPADTSARADSLVHRLASRYLSYAYRGASLRSSHPLHDSLFALRAGKGIGGVVVLVDTFSIVPESISHHDSVHTARVQAPHALTISRVWDTSNPRTGYSFVVRVEGNKVAASPRIVGWPALRRHVLKVEPDSGHAIIERLQQEWRTLRERPPAT